VREGGREGGRERETKRQTERQSIRYKDTSLSHTQAAHNKCNNKNSKKNHIIQQTPTPKPDAQDMVSKHISSSNLCQKRPISVKRDLLQDAHTRHGEPAYKLL
jgi:hypothetical protein